MKMTALIAQLLRVVMKLFSYKDKHDKEQEKQEHENEMNQIQEDPVSWINERYGSKKQNEKKQDQKKQKENHDDKTSE